MQLRTADAVAEYINEHRAGIGARPIDLVACETRGDPSGAEGCATELIQADVALTVMGETSGAAIIQAAMHDSGIPLFAYASADQSVLLDPDSTFALVSPTAGLSDLLNGLRGAGFEGPIDTLNSCVNDSVREAVGDYLEGVVVASPSPIGDPDDPGLRLLAAIVDTYGEGDIDVESSLATNLFGTMMGAREALDGLTGEMTRATIVETIRAMPETDLPGGGGLRFRCNGQAFPATPAVCTRGTLRTTLDAEGQPTLPYEPVGNSPIPD